ncbi:MAG: amidohydrolase family protein [Acidimicrobiales bacterium]
MRTIVTNGTLLDTETMELVGERHVVIEGDAIVDVVDGPAVPTGDAVVDAAGGFVMPGFVDAHVHHVVTTLDFPRLMRMSAVEKSLGMARLAENMVMRGFTTVRDTGGDVGGLIRAIATGLCSGPRIVRAGHALSQTGGHGDVDGGRRTTGATCACSVHAGDLGVVADGPDAVRTAARLELREGAELIKIMSSGGVASPADPIDAVQYTAEEIRAVTTETDHRHTYTTAHAYQPDAITQAIENGVRCIEHGNMVDEPTAHRMAELGVTMVPTLVTYKAMRDDGPKLGMPERNLVKNDGVYDAGRRSIAIARAAGVELGFGTDLLGEVQTWQNEEFAIRAELEPAADVLGSMYRTNARLCRREGRIGRIAPGYSADVVVARVDPLAELARLADPDGALTSVICRGRVMFDRGR